MPVKTGAMFPELLTVVGSKQDHRAIINAFLFEPGHKPGKSPIDIG
jgi:hypothetical protein